MADKQYFSDANEAFVEEDYKRAIDLYSKAIDVNSSSDDCYVARSHAFLKCEDYTDALEDAENALTINPNNAKAFVRKGIAQYHLKLYKDAHESLTNAIEKDDKNKATCESWLQKVQKELDLIKEKEETKKDTETNAEKNTPEEKEIPMPSGPKTRYDWYQTETHVIITILLKNVKKEDLTVDVQEQSLSVGVKLPGGNDYCLELDLAHPIMFDQTITKALSSKIEIKLKKQEGIRWAKLESDGEIKQVKHFNPSQQSSSVSASAYPSSSHYARNWDKIVTDIEKAEKDDKEEGDAALNSLFQQIYADGSDEVRKAMNKSFQESNGTVLSTNWGDIGKKKTEIKPPDGMEHKSWDQ